MTRLQNLAMNDRDVQGGTAWSFPSEDWEEWMDWDQTKEACPSQSTSLPSGSSMENTNPRNSLDAHISPGTSASANSPGTSISAQSPKKRKLSLEIGETSGRMKSHEEERKAVQDRSHSVVEKRYRMNLNQKIADLRNCVPSLRGGAKGNDNKRGMAPSQGYNKATVLTEAMAYINTLERRNAYLEATNAAMKDQIQSNDTKKCVESLLSGEDVSESLATDIKSESPSQVPTPPQPSIRGLIPVPEDMQRLRQGQSQEHYAVQRSSYARPENNSSGSVSVKGGKYIGRMLIGSLAGLMVVDNFVETRRERGDDRGLFALPFSRFVPAIQRLFASHVYPHHHLPPSHVLTPLVRAFLIFSGLGITLFLYLYYSKPPPRKPIMTPNPQPAPSLASPLEVRQNAWLTSMQTVWVPRHSMLPELLALILETHAYLTRQLLGWKCYSWITGRSEDEEIARVRAWDIAIDAQLSGGDPEISKSRLVLTLWAAGTLPNTPMRVMLKALHIRILFWQPSNSKWISQLLQAMSVLLARSQWMEAYRMQSKSEKPITLGGSEPLSSHLETLLDQPSDEVLKDMVIQRSHNLVWNRPTNESAHDSNDDVIEDSAMRGPLDALASWWSSSILQNALIRSMVPGSEAQEVLSQIYLAIRSAPPGSAGIARALAARAVFSDDNRQSSITDLVSTLTPSQSRDDLTSLSESSAAASNEYLPSSRACDGIQVAMQCAMALGDLQDSESRSVAVVKALPLLERVFSKPENMDLLAFAASRRLVSTLFAYERLEPQQRRSLELVLSNTRTWLGQPAAEKGRLNVELRKIVRTALQSQLSLDKVSRRISNASADTGYGSMSEGEEL